MTERRRNRSNKFWEAMQKQLEALVRDGGLRTALLVDRDGFVIAASDDNPANEMVGAASGQHMIYDQVGPVGDAGIVFLDLEDQDDSVAIHPFQLHDQPVLFIAMTDTSDLDQSLISRAVSGAKRIMA